MMNEYKLKKSDGLKKNLFLFYWYISYKEKKIKIDQYITTNIMLILR